MAFTLLEIATSTVYFGWVAGLFTAWGICLVLIPKSRHFSEAGAINAHHLCVIVPNIFLASNGVRLWFFDTEFADIFASDRLHPFYEPVNSLVLVMCAYQTWDLIVCLVTPKLREPANLAHHAATISGCLLCLSQCWGLYFAPFFVGVAEVSSVPLSFMDLFKVNKGLKDEFKTADEIVPALFAVLFLALRVIYWPFVAFEFSEDVLASGAGAPMQIATHGLNIGLLLLQWFWGSLIIRKIVQMAKGTPDTEHAHADARETKREPLLAV